MLVVRWWRLYDLKSAVFSVAVVGCKARCRHVDAAPFKFEFIAVIASKTAERPMTENLRKEKGRLMKTRFAHIRRSICLATGYLPHQAEPGIRFKQECPPKEGEGTLGEHAKINIRGQSFVAQLSTVLYGWACGK